ncbi:MAG TPA: FtsX-like permease family protein, partial [Verrucomicrobiales bacterium]|nr:FtsX-like permease family protein [Verrucomicrobiales bacterium]
AAGMFLFTSVETLQRSLRGATEVAAADTTLVVYRENRFCPATSRLPEYYAESIRRIEGVREVIPIKVQVNNCGASLDVVTFRGVPPDDLFRYGAEIKIVKGSLEEWKRIDDGALLGSHFAARRGLEPGDRFDAAGITVQVCGVIESPFPQDASVAYVKLPFLQQTSRTGLGVVTQFNVRVESAALVEPVAGRIDEEFRNAAEPTATRPEKAFFAETAGELIEIVAFTRWLGLGAVLAVAGLVGNALLLIVRARVREHALLRTLGYPDNAIGILVLTEGALLGALGGIAGVGLAILLLNLKSFTFSNEGQSLAIRADAQVLLIGLAAALGLSLLASLWPAWRALRSPIVENLRR